MYSQNVSAGFILISQKKKAAAWNKISRVLFILPAAIIYASIIIAPTLYSVYMSFFRWNGISPHRQFVGFQNYQILLTVDPTFRQALTNNFIWVLLVLIFTVAVALSFATLLNRQFKGRAFMRSAMYFPFVLSGIVVSIIWTWVYQPQLGLLTSFTQQVGLGPFPIALLANMNTALFAVYAASLWNTVGAPMLLFLAGLQGVPAEMLESARVDGANRFQVFFRITIPLLKETFVIVLATQIINALRVFDIIRGMTGGGPGTSTQTLATYMISQTFSFANFGMGSAISVIMVLLMMIIVIPYVLFMSRN